MAIKNKVEALVLKTIDSSTLTANFQAINSDGTEFACNIIRIVNDSNKAITVSYDGVNSNEYLRADSDANLNFNANLYPGRPMLLPKGTVVYVKGTAGTGTIALVGYGQGA